jgi:hypothetical protein
MITGASLVIMAADHGIQSGPERSTENNPHRFFVNSNTWISQNLNFGHIILKDFICAERVVFEALGI